MSSSMIQMNDLDIHSYNVGVLSCCKEGDLLEFPRFAFSHWGVYVGDEKVIHLVQVGDDWDKGEIKEDLFWDVVGNSLAKINNYLDEKKAVLPGHEIVERARGKVGPSDYDALKYNCEHFATWCRYKESFSEQVKNVIYALFGTIAGAGALVSASVSSR
ncbi:hypothetical protein Bbelb_122080 [Branchiostoma belcheri]|nr:hypothetical protein Bbelb_122080 [Branchiostoma belcheri]